MGRRYVVVAVEVKREDGEAPRVQNIFSLAFEYEAMAKDYKDWIKNRLSFLSGHGFEVEIFKDTADGVKELGVEE